MDKIKQILSLLKDLMDNKYTGQLRINLHDGDISSKMEKKDTIKI